MSRIEQIIGDIENYLDSCKAQVFSNSKKIVVEKDVLDELLMELRMRTPEEIKRYQKIIANKDEIIGEARRQADSMLESAEKERKRLVSENEIMREAYQQAQKLLEDTQTEAQAMIDKATEESDGIRQSAMDYTDYLLQGVQELLAHSMENFQSKFTALNSQMMSSYDVVTANRKELASQGTEPAEEQ